MKSGYPQTSPLHVSWQPGKGGHRILAFDIPARYAVLGRAIEQLPENLRDAIIVRYGAYPKLGNMTNRERAGMLGMSLEGFRSSVHRAERLLLDMGVMGKKRPKVKIFPQS